MTFWTEPHPAPVDASLRSGLLRQPLEDLIINSKPRKGQHRVSKAAQARRVLRQNSPQTRVRTLLVPPEQRYRALSIIKTLQDIPRFASRVPYVQCQLSSDIQLGYPRHRIWRLLGDATLPSLTREHIRQLRQTLIQDLSELYAKQLPYTPDLTRLEIVSKTSRDRLPRTIYRPLIAAYDFDLDVVGQAIPWVQLGTQKIRFVEAQFHVLEALAVLSQPHQPMRLSADLEPTCVARILRKHRPPVQQQNLVIRRVKTYSTELGQLVIELTRDHLRSLPWRTSPSTTPTQNATLNRCSIIDHTLGLINLSIKDKSECIKHGSLQKDRAALLVIYAVLLIHQHAKSVKVLASRGLLERASKYTADLYTSDENFDLVMSACRMAEDALDELAKQGAELGQDISWFIRTDA